MNNIERKLAHGESSKQKVAKSVKKKKPTNW